MKLNTTSKIVITTFLILTSLFVLFPIAIVFMNSVKGSLFISNDPFALPVFEGDDASFVGFKNFVTGVNKIHFFRAFDNFLQVDHFNPSSFFDFIYFPLFILASLGFLASSGIIHIAPAFCAPSILPSLQSSPTRLEDNPHLAAASEADIYFMCSLLTYIHHLLLYSKLGIISSALAKKCVNFFAKVFMALRVNIKSFFVNILFCYRL